MMKSTNPNDASYVKYAMLGIAACAVGYCIYKSSLFSQKESNSLEVQKIRVTPFHNIVTWDATQEDKEKISRTWMEKYVRSVLLKVSNSDSQSVEDHFNNPGNSIQSQTYNYSQNHLKKSTNDSLRRVIANEKGLLKQDDFEHIQKIIQVHSKSLLCSMRLQHRQDRTSLYQGQDWQKYLTLSAHQSQAEVKIYNKATIEILTIANVKTNVFNLTVGLFLIQGENQMLKTACYSIYSPFIFDSQVQKQRQQLRGGDDSTMSLQKCKNLLTQASEEAFKVMDSVNSQNLLPNTVAELMLFFDNLQADFLQSVMGIDVEYWQASCFKYGLQEDEEFVFKLTEICQRLKNLVLKSSML